MTETVYQTSSETAIGLLGRLWGLGYVLLPIGDHKSPLVNDFGGRGRAFNWWGWHGGANAPAELAAMRERFAGHSGRWAVCPASSTVRPLVVVDADTPEALAMMRSELPEPLAIVATSRGAHLYFDQAPEHRIGSNAGRLAPKVDVRGVAGYALLPRDVEALGSLVVALESSPRGYRGADAIASMLAASARVTTRTTARAGVASTSGGTLPYGATIEDAIGRRVPLRELQPGDVLGCYAPDREDAHPGAVAVCMDDGSVFVDDGGRRLWWLGRVGGDSELSDVIELGACGPGRWLADVAPQLRHKLPGASILAAPVGSGKSTLCDLLALDAARVLTVTPERGLTRALATARASAFYRDNTDGEAPRVASTVHSLHKLAAVGDRWDLVVVEEAPLVADVLFSETADRSGGGRAVLYSLLDHMGAASRVLLQSADIDGREAAWWSEALAFAGHPGAVVFRATAPEGSRSIALHNAARLRDLWLADVADHEAGGPPLAMQTSRTGADDRGAEVRALRPDLRVLVVSSDNASDSDVAALLAEPSRLTSDFDVIILSPAVRSGVSITGPVRRVYVDAFVGRSSRETPSCASVLQSVGRFRYPLDTTIRASVAAFDGNGYGTEPAELQAIARSKARSGEALVSLSPIQWEWTREDAREPEAPIDRLMLDLWCIREAQARRESNDRVAELARLAHAHGWTVEDHRGELVDAARVAELRASQGEARALLVVEHRAAMRSGPRTGKQEAEARELVGFYGVPHDALTDEQIDGGAELRNGLRDLVAVGSVQVARFLGVEDRARLIGSALDAAGLDPEDGGHIDADSFGAWLGLGTQGDRLRAILGTAERRPAQLAGALVRHLGGTTKRRETSRGGERVRSQCADFRGAWKLAGHARSVLIDEAAEAAKGFTV